MKKFTDEQSKLLMLKASKAKKSGESLSWVFSEFAKETGRAKGSIRNYYYQMMKSKSKENSDEIDELGLKVERNLGFTKEEEKELVINVLGGVKLGKSVRKSIIDLAKGDEKLQLRVQNKYRNLLKLNPLLIEEVCAELGIENGKIKQNKHIVPKILDVSMEIDRLIDRLKEKYRAENQKLMIENAILKQQLEDFRLKTDVKSTDYFIKSKKKSI